MEQRIQEIGIDERVMCEEDGEEFEIIVRCRKCNREELHA